MYKYLVINIMFVLFTTNYTFALDVTVGASGANYITDGTSDELEIQAAINAVHVAGGGTVTLLEGSYNIQQTRLTPKSKVILTGTNNTILFSNRTYDYLIFNQTGSIAGFQLKNLTINANNADHASGVRFERANNVLIENVRFMNANCGWHLVIGINGNDAQNQEVYSRDNGVRNCLFDGHSGSLEMLLLFNSKNTLVENCIFQNKSATACNVSGGRPTLGLWQKTDSVSIKNCQFANNASPETIYYSNTSNNTLIENCTFINSGGIRGANESDWGTFGVAHATGLMIRDCIFTGGANSYTQSAIQLGAVYNVLVKNCTIRTYEEGIVFDNGNFSLNNRCQHFAVVNTTIQNCNPANNVHGLHAGVLMQSIGGNMKGYFICGNITDNQASPTQRQAVSFYVYNTPSAATPFNEMYFLGTNIVSYLGHPTFVFYNDAQQGNPFVYQNCSGASPPAYCSSCPNITNADAVAWINTYDPTTATIIQNLLNYPLNAVLDIEILDFQGIVKEEGNFLSWKIGDMHEAESILLEQSENGKDFTPLSIVSKNQDFYLDKNPFPITYYRLKIRDLGGKMIYSKIISLQNTKAPFGGLGVIKIYPNPVSDILNIDCRDKACLVPTMDTRVEIVNILGQTVLHFPKLNDNKINVSGLENGVYFLKVWGNVLRFVKE